MKIAIASLICCFLFIRSTPSLEDVHLQKGIQYMDAYQYPEAIAEFDLSIQINPKNWVAYYDQSICYGEINERQKAFDGYTKAYALKKSAVTSNGMGIGHLGLDRIDVAKTYFAMAIQLDKSDHTGYFNMGFALNREKQFEEALRYFNLALGLKPDHVNSKLSKMDVLFTLEQYQACLEETESLVAMEAFDSDVYEYMGRSLSELEQFEKALVAFDKAISIDPENLSSYLHRASANHSLERYEAEIPDRTIVIESFVEAKATNYLIGQSYFFRGAAKGNAGDLDGAIEDYNISLTYEPKQSGTYINRSVTKIQMGDLEGACVDYQHAIQLEPSAEEIFTRYVSADPEAYEDFLIDCEIGDELPEFDVRTQPKKLTHL
jgi:tetratricopeptide (TPR) repeat protein